MLNPKFEYGSEVRLISNIRNDGSFDGSLKGKCLMRRGSTGFVRHAGYYLQDQVVYQIHFLESNQIIGCKETELVSASLPWTMNAFEYGDSVCLTIPLKMNDQLIAQPGDDVSIIAVQRETDAIEYRIQLNDLDIVVPERALAAKTKDIAL
jgi:nitrogen fixation protein NifZ